MLPKQVETTRCFSCLLLLGNQGKSRGNRTTKHFVIHSGLHSLPQTEYEADVNYNVSIGLLILLGLSAQVFINTNLQTNPHANNTPSAVLTDDPERLFVEAMTLAETGARGDDDKRVDEACLLWTERGDPERAGRARLQIGDLYRNDKRFDE